MASEILANPKHEIFAQAMAEGKSRPEAYKQAGYKSVNDSSAHTNACRLLKNRQVVDRIYSIRVSADEQALRIMGLSKAKILTMLMDNATNAPEAAARNRALELAGKEQGMFIDRTQSQVTVKSIADLPDSDLVAILAQAEEAEKRKERVQ